MLGALQGSWSTDMNATMELGKELEVDAVMSVVIALIISFIVVGAATLKSATDAALAGSEDIEASEAEILTWKLCGYPP